MNRFSLSLMVGVGLILSSFSAFANTPIISDMFQGHREVVVNPLQAGKSSKATKMKKRWKISIAKKYLLGDRVPIIPPACKQSKATTKKAKRLNVKCPIPPQAFLMTTAFISGHPVGTGRFEGSKVVFFKLSYDKKKLLVYEARNGRVVTENLTTNKLLPVFKVRPYQPGDDKNRIYFDFDSGTKSLIEAEEWAASDYPAAREKSYKVDRSVVVKAWPDSKRQGFFVDQQVVVRPNSSTTVNFTMKYGFYPYQLDTTFRKKESTKMEKVGFFETAKVIAFKSARAVNLISRFDVSNGKTITFHFTRNTPNNYQQAVIDGILYWNEVFQAAIGRRPIKAAILPPGVRAHDPGYHIVQWVGHDGAGFAYANMRHDPLTGKSLQGHVYMTSVFAKGGLNRGRKLLLSLHKHNLSKNQAISIGLKSFRSGVRCQYRPQTPNLGLLNNLAKTALFNRKSVLRFAQDYVREVVAHEIGHVLGLRHNFAASTASTIKPDHLVKKGKKVLFKAGDLKKIMKKYMKTGVVDSSVIPASSVMDYIPTSYAVLNGARIRLALNKTNKSLKKYFPLAYDVAAIKYAYSNISLDKLKAPLFCTDSRQAYFQDCLVWDFAKDPFSDALSRYYSALSDVPLNLANKFLMAKTAEHVNDRKSPRKVPLNPISDQDRLINGSFLPVINKILTFSLRRKVVMGKYVIPFNRYNMVKTSRFLAVELNDKYTYQHFFPFHTENDRSLIKTETEEYIQKGFDRLGLTRMISDMTPFRKVEWVKTRFGNRMRKARYRTKSTSNFETNFNKLVNGPFFQKGYTTKGKALLFNEPELRAIRRKSQKYFRIFEKHLVGNFVQNLGALSISQLRPMQYKQLRAALNRLVTNVVLAQSSDVHLGHRMGEKGLERTFFHKPYYSHAVRFSAARLLRGMIYPSDGFPFVSEKKALKMKLIKRLKSALGTHKKAFSMAYRASSPQLRKMFKNELMVIKSL